MTKRGYGSWNFDEFFSTVVGMSPYYDCEAINVTCDVEGMKKRGVYDSFVEAFREFLLDDSIDFAKKAEIYLQEEFWSSAKSWDYCKWLWDLIAPDQPWPLERKPRPAEPTGKPLEFKPQ